MAKHKTVCTRGWNSARNMYVCADSTHIKISRKSFKYCEPDEDYSSDSTEPEIVEKHIAPKSGVVYKYWRDILQPQIFVSEALYDRKMLAVAMGADNARTVVFPKTVKTVQSCAFRDVVFLQSAVLNEGLLTIWNQAFQNSGLRKVIIPSTLLDVGKSAFARCSSLTRVDFSEGSRLEAIGNNCFCQTAVTEMCIPSSVALLGSWAFHYCKWLKRVTFRDDSKLEKIGYGCFCQSDLEEIRTPPSLLEIENSAFEMCGALKRVTLNEGIRTLGKGDSLPKNFGGIFQDSGVKYVTLPGSLREMCPNTFSGCKSLRAIWVGKDCAVDVRKYVGASVRVLQK